MPFFRWDALTFFFNELILGAEVDRGREARGRDLRAVEEERGEATGESVGERGRLVEITGELGKKERRSVLRR